MAANKDLIARENAERMSPTTRPDESPAPAIFKNCASVRFILGSPRPYIQSKLVYQIINKANTTADQENRRDER